MCIHGLLGGVGMMWYTSLEQMNMEQLLKWRLKKQNTTPEQIVQKKSRPGIKEVYKFFQF
ncbi:hypothetical protein EBI_25521 [Enterocytozoon bieneusi H348]|nr:hypothetical protein EBI_25521 [Enterocytozoon bieneusi H348]|eukprot:XP_002650671.1 hypothetical protein EBI_25521 [Enterocytozoon bieneusi H348]